MNKNIKTIVSQYKTPNVSENTKVREILQQAALMGLERHGFFEHAAFYGGTALRLLYKLDRFSEDLDFTLLNPNPKFDFYPFLQGIQEEISSLGFSTEVTIKQKNIETSVMSAFMKTNTIELLMAIGEEKQASKTNHNQKIQIKIEIDTDPPGPFRVENHLLLNPTSFYVLTLHKSDLFAGKMAAILFRAWKGRVKGRDWYDLVWYIQNQTRLSLSYLESCMQQSGNLPKTDKLTKTKLEVLLENKIKGIDWESAKEDIRPFISDPKTLDIWSSTYFLQLIRHLQCE